MGSYPPVQPPARVRYRHLIALSGLTAAIYLPTLFAPFHLDDTALFSDPIITSPSGWWFVWRPLQTRPLTWFTFWVNYWLGGERPGGYHAVNILLHVATVCLMYRLFQRIACPEVALTAAALFAVHPIQAEPVAYVFERATILATLFCLLSAEAWLSGHWPRSIGFFAFALLSKEECVSFPFFLLLLRPAIGPAMVMVGLSAAAGVRVLLAIELLGIRGAGTQAGISWLDYLLTQGTVILRYARLFVVPYGFSCDPEISVVTDWRAYGSWCLILAVTALVWRFARYGKWFVAGLVLLAPSSSIFPAEDLAADRRLYLPMVALAGFVALSLPRGRRYSTIAVAAGLVGLGTLTLGRVYVWQSEERLWTEALERGPGKVRPRILLSRIVSDEATVMRLLTEARMMAPTDNRPALEMGIRLLGWGQDEAALKELREAVRLAPHDVPALTNLGVALAETGQREAAIHWFQEALRHRPCSTTAVENLQKLGVPTAGAGCPERNRASSGVD